MQTSWTLRSLVRAIARVSVFVTVLSSPVVAGSEFIPVSQARCLRAEYHGSTYGEFCEPHCVSWSGSCQRCAEGFEPFDAGLGHERCFLGGGWAWQRSRIEDRMIVVASRAEGSAWGLMGCANTDSETSTFSAVFEITEPLSVVLRAEATTSVPHGPDENAQARVTLFDDETGVVLAELSIDGTTADDLDATFDLAAGRYRLEVDALTPMEPSAEEDGVAEVAAVLRICAEDVDRNGAVSFADILRILSAWGPCGECPEDIDNSGVVDFADILAVLAAWGPCRAEVDWAGACCEGSECADGSAGSCGAGFIRGATCTTIVCGESESDVSLTIEPYVGEGWVENGFAGLTAYRVYAGFDPTAELASAYGTETATLRVTSSDGTFHNDSQFDSLTAPVDLRSIGIWSNQWDSYVTIGTTEATGDDTDVSPGFAAETNGLSTSFESDNAGWYIVPATSEQGDGPAVLLAQFVVAEGETIDGVLNALLDDGLQRSELPFQVDITTPCD